MGADWAAIVSDTQLRAWRLRGMSIRRIAELCGTSQREVEQRIKDLWRSAQARSNSDDDGLGQVEREEDEASKAAGLRLSPLVEAAAEEIRKRWTVNDEFNRRVMRGKPVEAVAAPDIRVRR